MSKKWIINILIILFLEFIKGINTNGYILKKNVKHFKKNIIFFINNKKYKLKNEFKLNYNFNEKKMEVLNQIEKDSKILSQSPEWNSKKPLLEIKNLHVQEVEKEKEILKGVNLKIYLGEKHTIMGRNGSGKSTLAKIITGHPFYKITEGEIIYKGLNINNMSADIRSLIGIFLAFQHPIELSMINNSEFLKEAVNSHRKFRNEKELSNYEFKLLVINEIKKVGLDIDFLDRSVNFGFSGGEKKRNEILQMLLLKPTFCILDETDSGLDVDSFKLTSNILKEYSNENNSFLIVTHYKKILEYLKPNYIHIFSDGKIIKSGDFSLIEIIESKGFSTFLKEQN